MAGGNVLTLIGNLTADPELRYTPTGTPVVYFTVASTPRYFDKSAGQWKDGDALFQRCTLWHQPAENVADTLHKGHRVVVHGRLRQRTFHTSGGDKRTSTDLDVEDIGPSLRYATGTITKTRGTAPQQHA